MVEAQHRVSTARLTDNLAEQELLERLIDDAKPPIPEECRHLHYLLYTPFRYGSAYPTGSRFRRPGMTLGVFYSSETSETAAAEIAFHRLLFFAESPATPWPTTTAQFTAFSAKYATGLSIDLSSTPFRLQRKIWMHLTDYGGCRRLAENARSAAIDVIKYQSARDPHGGKNIALLSCRAFRETEPGHQETWRIHLSASGIRAYREFPKFAVDFDRTTFGADSRIASMRWDR